MSTIKNLLIVGGGTAGWLTAAFLNKHLERLRPGYYRITVVESADIGVIGVGEATVPTLLRTLQILGIDELEFMQSCQASFKHGIKFVDWLHAPGTPSNYYYHPFNRPGALEGLDLVHFWQAIVGPGNPSRYAASVTPQVALCEHDRCPKFAESKPFEAPIGYAYHLDAVLFGQLLRDKALERGVHRIEATIDSVQRLVDGGIESVRTRDGTTIAADLFVDCTGFRGLLINETLETRFVSYSDQLFCDRAVACQIPLPDTDSIKPYTTSTAMKFGWIWEIHLHRRRGIGYVYSSRYVDDDSAEQELREYIGFEADGIEARRLQMRVGRNDTHWNKNVVAVGLSAGFIEPLESSGIYLIEMAARLLADFFPHHGIEPSLQRRFNEHINGLYDETMNFIVMHYCLTQREDTQFWYDNKHHQAIPQALAQDLEMWQHRMPTPFDRGGFLNFFNHETYQYVLAGMDRFPPTARSIFSSDMLEAGKKRFADVQREALAALKASPDHREYLNLLNEY